MIRWWVAEIGLVALWVMMACVQTQTTVWSCAISIAFGLVALALPQAPRELGQVSKADWLWLVGLFVLVGTHLTPDTLVLGYGVIGVIVFTAHVEQTFRPPAQVAWSGLVTLVACALVALMTRLPLVVRSSKPIEPGQLTFLLFLSIWFLLMIGTVTHLRQRDPTRWSKNISGALKFLWARRHAVLLTIVGSIHLGSVLV